MSLSRFVVHLLQPKQHWSLKWTGIGLLSKSHGIEPHHLQSPFSSLHVIHSPGAGCGEKWWDVMPWMSINVNYLVTFSIPKKNITTQTAKETNNKPPDINNDMVSENSSPHPYLQSKYLVSHAYYLRVEILRAGEIWHETASRVRWTSNPPTT